MRSSTSVKPLSSLDDRCERDRPLVRCSWKVSHVPCRNDEYKIALPGICRQSSYLMEIPDFAPSPRDEFAFFSVGWSIRPGR